MADVTGTYYEGGAFHGYGSQLLVSQNDSPETFVAIADVSEITPGDMTTAVIEKTPLTGSASREDRGLA
jgi:hypothetical protein